MFRFCEGFSRQGLVWAAVLALAVMPRVGMAEAVQDRLRQGVTWLAAPEREGRGPGTAGIEAAAAWVAGQFADLGLAPPAEPQAAEPQPAELPAAEPFQPFAMTLEEKLGAETDNVAEIVGPPDATGSRRLIRLALGTDFTPLAAGGTGAFDLPLAFAGYGITAPAEKYDDYAPLAGAAADADAGAGDGAGGKGQAVIVLRQEPQKDDPHSVFDGNQASQHAALARKVANASEHEVGGLVFVNDASDDEALMAFTRAGEGSARRTLPILHVQRVIDLIDDLRDTTDSLY